MRTDYELNLCFIRETAAAPDFEDRVEEELEHLFSGLGYWYSEYKTVDQVEMVVAEVKGVNRFSDEQEALDYLHEAASERFWTWLQGYRIVVEQKEGACSHCKA